jgi:hypothetical protein
VAQLAFSLAARCSWLPCPARAARPWRPPALKMPTMRRYTGVVRGPYQLGFAAMARWRWSSSVEAAWLAGRRRGAALRTWWRIGGLGSGRQSAVAGDGEARRRRRCACGGTGSGAALGQRGVAASDRGARTQGGFMARRDSSAAPGSQSGCFAWRLGH